jgi:hypothetical protein
MRCVRESFLTRKINKYFIFLRARARARWYMIIAYPACNAYAPYFDVICGPAGSTSFFLHYLINGAIFIKKKVIEHKMCVLSFFAIPV